jgi:hypothetical protein
MSSNGRAAFGRFTKGNPGGPGRPPRPVEADYLRMVTAGCPPETWRRIVDRAVSDATAGDAKAREWLGRYLLGLPKDGALVKEAAVFQMERTKKVDMSDETMARIVAMAVQLRAPTPT